jgi:hypothetical protein
MQSNRFAPTPDYAMAPANEGGAGRRAPTARAAEIGDGAPDAMATPDAASADWSCAHAETVAASAPQVDDALAPRNAPPPPAPKSDIDKRIPDKGFPETWRQDLAGNDRAFRKTLDRFDSPAALAKAYRELTARLSSGELKSTKPPPDTAAPEQVAAWRAEHGLPESAAAYVDGLQLGDGTVTGEAEKALLASFAEQAMNGHWTAAQYNQAVGWYFDLQDSLAAQRDHTDGAFKHEASAELKREWGHDYAVNRNACAVLRPQLPGGFQGRLAHRPSAGRQRARQSPDLQPGDP